MHWASKRNHLEVVEYLLDIGASSETLNNDGKSPAYYTINKDIKILLKQGMNQFRIN